LISVCMATFNGERFIKEQVASILSQIRENDELVISDDRSRDRTVEILKEFKDPRIKIYMNQGTKGPVSNFRNALIHSTGEYIFLSDQDDIWLPGRVDEALKLHQTGYDLVTCNCFLIDENGQKLTSVPYFNEKHPLKKNFFYNLYENSVYGCCMSFNRKLLLYSLPFPKNIIMHDVWIGMLAKVKYKCGYIDQCLILYRRHGGTASFGKIKGGKQHKISNLYRIRTRLYLFFHVLFHIVLKTITS